MFVSLPQKYHLLQTSELQDEHEEGIFPDTVDKTSTTSTGHFFVIATVANIFLFISSLFLFLLSIQQQCETTQLLRCMFNHYQDKPELTQRLAPALDMPNYPTKQSIQKMSAELFEPRNSIIYRSSPTKAVDEAWNRISNPGFFILSASQIKSLGKDPSLSVRAPAHWGYGNEAYLAQIDAFHTIHCLNVLRQEANHNYHYYHGNTTQSERDRNHFEHCLYVLLQNLMCKASADMYTYVWMETQLESGPFPDFNINHQCGNYEALVDWQKENEVPRHLWEGTVFSKPEGAKVVEASQALKDWALGHEGEAAEGHHHPGHTGHHGS